MSNAAPASPAAAPARWRSAGLVASRTVAAVFGGYAFTWGFTTLLIALALRAGLPFGEARTLAYLLAFGVMLAAFLWSFATPRLTRLWAVLAGGGTAMTGLAWWLAQP